MAKKYTLDSDDEAMYLEMLQDMNFDTAMDIYQNIKSELAGTYLSNTARLKPFSELSYRNLRYLILNCERCGAELRVKALATFVYRATLPKRFNVLVSNTRLMELLHKNMYDSMNKIYEWSNVKYNGN